MTAIGCCGRRTSLAGLLAEADFHPASSPTGRMVRAKLAYTIAAGKAAQIGNKPAYDRAMRGLNGLGLFSSSDPVVTQRASTAVTAAVRTAATGPTLSQTMATVGTVANLLATFASSITAIAGVSGGDPGAVAAAQMVIGWVRAIVNGTTPSIPSGLDANTLNGFVAFCAQGGRVKYIVDAAFGLLIGGIQAAAAANHDANLAAAGATLLQVQTRLDGMFDGICAAVGAQITGSTVSCPPNSTRNAAGDCACNAGYSSAIVPDQCLSAQDYCTAQRPGSTYDQATNSCQGGGTSSGGLYIRPLPFSVPVHLTLQPPAQATKSVALPLAAAAAAAFFFLR